MSRQLFRLSGKPDGFLTEIFELIHNAAGSAGIPFFAVGAAARDMILECGYNICTIRATKDIDIGVQVSDWNQYSRLKKALTATGKFKPGRDIQTLLHESGIPADIIPFGSVADCVNSLTFPPDHETEMNIQGFEEAYCHSLLIRLRSEPALDIRFASLTGLALMKIISWNGRGSEKDAQDLALLIRTYADAGNLDRLYNEESDLLEAEDFNLKYAGARLLGRDIAKILTFESGKTVLEILSRETGGQKQYRLVQGMMRERPILTHDFDDTFEEKLRQLNKLKSGVLDIFR